MDLIINIAGTIGSDPLPPGLAADLIATAQVFVDAVRGLCLARSGGVASEVTAATVTIGADTFALTLPAPTVAD